MPTDVIKELTQMQGAPSRLERSSFDFYEAEADTESLIATYEAPNPMVLRADKPVRIVITAFEVFEADGTEYELEGSVAEAPQSSDVMAWTDEGDKVKTETPDYGDDTIELKDDPPEDAEEILINYISDDDAEVVIEKEAPRSAGSVTQTLFDAPLSLLHQRDQDEQPRYVEEGESPLQRVVPTDWQLNVYIDGEYDVHLEDAETGVVARNAVLSMPYKQGRRRVEGLGNAVAHDVIDNS